MSLSAVLLAGLAAGSAEAQIKLGPTPMLGEVGMMAGVKPVASSLTPVVPSQSILSQPLSLGLVSPMIAADAFTETAPAFIGRIAQSARNAPKTNSSRLAEALDTGLTEVFDGMARSSKDRVLVELEGVVKQSPKDVALRHAFVALLERDELATVEAKLRDQSLSASRLGDVLSKTTVHEIHWWHYLSGKIRSPEAHGSANPDGTLNLHVHGNWRRISSLAAHFRTLFTHEYTHRLQHEGEFNGALYSEPSAVAAELLRAIELVGLASVARGAMDLIGPAIMDSFRSGVTWAESPLDGRARTNGIYFKGFIAGAAYQLAQSTGRWDDAWAYLRRVSIGEDPLIVERDLRRSSAP